MQLRDFRIGLEFYCGDKKWRCTDVGSRVVIAIRIGPHEIVTLETQAVTGKKTDIRCTTEDPSWYNGPPYAIAETVFDESSIEGCSLEPSQHDQSAIFFPGARRNL